MLRSLIDDEDRAALSAAILGIIGFLDIPLIHMSVYWWRTLHQPPSILRLISFHGRMFIRQC